MWSTDFISQLNNGIDLYRTFHEARMPEHMKTKDMEWAMPVEHVIIGPCSSNMSLDPISEINATIRRNEISGCTVLVISNCCGQYNKEQKDRIRDANPGISFLFPYIPDFYDNFDLLCEDGYQSMNLAEALLKAGILRQAAS